MTICIPFYKDNPNVLLHSLARLEEIKRCALLVYDDGTRDELVSSEIRQIIDTYPTSAMLITCENNKGRSTARNRLTMTASTDWMLLLDADMLPDETNFLKGYLDYLDNNNAPALVTGGYSVLQAENNPSVQLHIEIARRSSLPADQRAKQAGRYVFTSNILVHRKVLDTVPFDEQFIGWGWEDVDWGLRVVENFPVIHLDHTATHLGLESTEKLLEKYSSSGANFARVVQRHPTAAKKMALLKMIHYLHALPPIRLRFVRQALKKITRTAALSPLPIRLRLLALKAFRALHYYEHVI